MGADVHLNDIGTIFELTILDQDDAVVNVSSAVGAGTKVIRFEKPDGSVVSQEAVFSTNGTDGKIRYVSLSGDIDQVGTWSMQGFVNITAGEFSTECPEFPVRPNKS